MSDHPTKQTTDVLTSNQLWMLKVALAMALSSRKLNGPEEETCRGLQELLDRPGIRVTIT